MQTWMAECFTKSEMGCNKIKFSKNGSIFQGKGSETSFIPYISIGIPATCEGRLNCA